MHNSKGLTLMEVLVTVSILTIVFGMTFGAMRIYDVSISMGSTKSNLSAQATQALNKMREELSKSTASRVIVNDGGVMAGKPLPDSIDFQIPMGLDANQNIQWGDGGIETAWIEYYLRDNQLVKMFDVYVTTEPQIVLANDITNLRFTLSGNSLTIDVTASKAIQRGIIPALSVTMSTRVDFKN